MNWKKIFVGTLAGAFAGSLGHYTSELSQGHAIAFTAGNILLPAAMTVVSTLAALFVKPPHQDGQ